MKLLLASNGRFLIEEGYKLLGLPRKEIRIGYITTASKGVNDLSYLDRHRSELNENGYKFEEIDIENKSLGELKNFFAGKNVIHIEGGNTFYLLKAFKETGFDKVVIDLVKSGMVYVGSSAGAYITCPTTETSTWKTDIKDNYGLTDLTALNLVPFLLKVHYTEDKKEIVMDGIKKSNYPVRILRDGQGILVEEEDYFFAGEGRETILDPRLSKLKVK